jgi:hypothetical protein
VTATERGRWFLAEFAKRNRGADTDLIMAAIARIETAIGAGAPQATLSRDPEVVAATAAAVEASRASGGERDEVAARDTSPPQKVPDARSQSDKDYSEAVAAIAASLTTRLEESAKESDAQVTQEVTQEVAQQPDRAAAALEDGLAAAEMARPERTQPAPSPLPGRVPQDNAQRWHIEAPDFVFGAGDQDINIGSIELQSGSLQSKSLQSKSLQPKSPQMHAQLLGAELIRAEEWVETPSDAAEAPQPVVAVPDPEPVPAAAESPRPAAAMLDIAPLAEISRPQLRIAREAMPVGQRAPRYGSLTVTDALSEDEVIALFG